MNFFAKTLLGLVALTASFPGFCDDFEDLIQASATVANNYNGAIDAPKTRYDQEYRAHLQNFRRLAIKVQTVIRSLSLGQDFNFPAIANELDLIYTGNSGRSKKQASPHRENLPYSASPEGLLKMLQFDINELRKMDFTTEDGGSIKASLETRRKLKEFDRLFNFFRENAMSLRKNQTDVSLQKFFDARTSRMQSLSMELSLLLRKNDPGSSQKYNLQEETETMVRSYNEMADAPDKNQNQKKRPFKTNRLDGKNTTALRTEMSVSVRRIREILIQLDHSGFESDPPLRARSSADNDSDDPAAALKKEGKSAAPYADMSRTKLVDELEKRRNEIFRGNTSMDGFDPQSERLYLLTLSRDQKKLYTGYLKEFQDLGYSSGLALRSAILKIHTKLKNEKESAPTAEIVKMLERLDKEEKKIREEQKVKFDLKKGSSGKL
ncbi:MAG: hypothetical protein BWY31_03009 [Lentisphaerae bacterium ADurb.Bin242]|nr:MAG: hypothetical protein BWY31_03009 [Lentisphaerae bacterium ADurb.Bin242]